MLSPTLVTGVLDQVAGACPQVVLTGTCHPAGLKPELLAELPFENNHSLGMGGKRQGGVCPLPILTSVPDLGIPAVCGTQGC